MALRSGSLILSWPIADKQSHAAAISTISGLFIVFIPFKCSSATTPLRAAEPGGLRVSVPHED